MVVVIILVINNTLNNLIKIFMKYAIKINKYVKKKLENLNKNHKTK